MAELYDELPVIADLTFEKAKENYLQTKYNVLSPSTRKGYEMTYRRLSETFKKSNLKDINQLLIQAEINNLAVKYSAKTVANTHGLISAVLALYRPDLNLKTLLPKKTEKKLYLPTDAEVGAVLNHVKDTIFYVPFYLGTLGMRRSEICAIRAEHLNGTELTIRESKVTYEKNKFLIKKTTKNASSTKTIYIPQEIADLICFKHMHIPFLFTAIPSFFIYIQ